jgi:hypothetical protein
MIQSLVRTLALDHCKRANRKANYLKDTPRFFFEMFDKCTKDVYGDRRCDCLDELQTDLQRRQYLKV